MAYNVAANMQFARPVSAFLDAKDNVMRNALAERQVANAEGAQQFQQQRLTAADQIAAEQRAKASEQEDKANLFNYFSHLSKLKANPQQFAATAQRMLQSDLFRRHQIEAEDLTPEQIDEVLPLFAAEAGQAPVARFEQVQGPRGSIMKRNVDTGELVQVVGPDNTESPVASQRRFRTLSKEEIAAAGLQPGGVYQQDEVTGAISVVSKPDTRSGGGGGLPVGALRLVDEAKQAINSSRESLSLVDRAIGVIGSGRVNLGLVSNAVSRGRNLAGMSSDSSRAFTDVKQTLEKLRNNYLLLAKGVQTEGDAQRAWNSEIGENVQNDNKLATQQLTKAKGLIERMVQMQQDRIDTVYANYGSEPPQSGVQNSTSPATGGKKRVRVDANGDVIP